MSYEYKNISEGSIKDVDQKQGIVTGYLAAFGNVDAHGEVINPGAFKKTLQERGTKNIKYLINHNQTKPIGVFTELKEDHHGLLYTAKIGSHALGKDFMAMATDGLITEHSVGIKTIKKSESGGIRYLQEVALYEGSALTFFGANSNTPLLSIKSHTGIQERIDLLLKTYTNSSFNNEAFQEMQIELKHLISKLTTPQEPEVDEIELQLRKINQLFGHPAA